MSAALIWGASGGIGSEIVRLLKQKDFQVFAAARDETKIPPESDFAFPFDASRPDSIAHAVMMVAQQTSGIDLMVYAAGGIKANPLDKTNPDEWQQVMDVNLNSAYLAARASLDVMNKGGHMMFLGAYIHKITLPRMGAYTTAKAGLESMVTILQKENRKLNISLVRLPAVDTPFWENVPFNLPEAAMKPQAVAQAILTHYESGKGTELNL